MALRSRIGSIARPPAPDVHEELVTETAPIAHRGRIGTPVHRQPEVEPEPEIEQVPQTDAMQEPDLEVQAEAESDPTPEERIETERAFHAEAPAKRTRTKRMPDPEPEPAIDEPTTAPQLRLAIRDLEAAVKDARARHEIELSQLRQRHRDLHDKLFDLVR